MTVGDACLAGREHLAALGIDEAAITAEVLLRHALQLTRTGLYRAWHQPLDEGVQARYLALLEERARGRPVAYIVGRREFMGLAFAVDERVLIPRPETELVVETVVDLLRGAEAPVIADVGTGSGAIAVSLAVLRPDATLIATDLSAGALEVARANAARHGVGDRLVWREGDLLRPLLPAGRHLDAVVCNPPYVDARAAAGLPREIREFEPALAVMAPGPGEAVHGRLASEAPRVVRPGGWLVMEVAAGQASRVVELVQQTRAYGSVQVRRDGLGWERVVAARVEGSGAAEASG